MKNRLPNNNTLYWRQNDFTVFFLMFILFLGIAIVIIFNYNTDWWMLSIGLSYVFLFLFIICKKVEV